ncbi:MAG: Tfp pilus assembly protein FimT/FimU [Gemmatimonadaceae bacterium]
MKGNHMRHGIGITLTELVIVLAMLGILLGVGLPRVLHLSDRLAVRSAAAELKAALNYARHLAQMQARVVAIRFDTARASTITLATPDTLQFRMLGAEHGVALAVTRDSIAYGPSGRGYGAANTSIVISRGSAANTTFVSRLGRVR